ncbi:hypothetical protein Asp14428_77600 [Actinoplanes sp. NBRC 14428]|uniref:Uncharacterized protein n=1 Tax=Pseudosporangium ferrugineum TaxID=439699 RepID=A0A2T0RWZ2_9ACTN|nr:hypothetical protein [Pseudosporangium ferrugineum]PRY25670.1 hypothetical protein CLV70_11236 [Pseudosporangium ferrugineum]BCJ56285.1 hypothetical protein Asp14428_77600 [Actinoplanes sp. NBRC 14428]
MEHISAELLSAVVTVVGGLGVSGLTRAWILHRTRLQLARERSARAAARAAGLTQLAGRPGSVRIDERDEDGHRVVELHGPGRAAAGEAA